MAEIYSNSEAAGILLVVKDEDSGETDYWELDENGRVLLDEMPQDFHTFWGNREDD